MTTLHRRLRALAPVLATALVWSCSTGSATVPDAAPDAAPEADPAHPTPAPVPAPSLDPAASPDPDELDREGADPTAPKAEAPTELEPPAGSVHADLDPDNDAEVGPPEALPDCEARLAEAGITWRAARIGVGRKRDGVYTCGAPQVVRYRAGPEKITYSKSSPLLTCGMALALADFERIVQEEAERELGRRVVEIEHLGTYNCREMAAYDLISEHSFANGIDIRRLRLQGGDVVDVLKHFRPEDDPASDPKSKFLRRLANRLYDEKVFSVVVTPFFDALHRNHIHVDLARYRVDGSRP